MLRPGDRIVAIDGRAVTARRSPARSLRCTCAARGRSTNGCAATTTVARHRRPRRAHARRSPCCRTTTPRLKRMLLGVDLGRDRRRAHFGLFGAIGTSAAALWDVGYLDRRRLRQGVHELEGAQAAPERRRDHAGHPAGGRARSRLLRSCCSRSSRSCSRSSTCSRSCRSTAATCVWSVAEKVRGKRVSFGGDVALQLGRASCCSRSWCSTASATTSAASAAERRAHADPALRRAARSARARRARTAPRARRGPSSAIVLPAAGRAQPPVAAPQRRRQPVRAPAAASAARSGTSAPASARTSRARRGAARRRTPRAARGGTCSITLEQ